MSDEPAIGTEEATEPTRPEWLPENFNEPEALVKSYKEAERKLHELSTQNKQLAEEAARVKEWEEWYEQQQAATRAGDPREKLVEIWEDPERAADFSLQMLQRQAELEKRIESLSKQGPDPAQTELTAHYVETQMRNKFGDWDAYAEKIGDVVQNNPGILGITEQTTPAQAVKNVEAVYWMVKGQQLSTPEGQAAQDAAEAARIAKQQAQTLSGQGVRPATQSDDEAYAASLLEIAKNSGGYGS